ncbi:MAG: alpha-amylase family glycosyl hydrolase, partial [Ignavibacteriaceae bacterium]
MKQVNLFIIAILICLISCTQNKQQHLADIIKPVNLNTEDTTKILLSDLFYSEHYDVKFLPNKNFNVVFNNEENTIAIIPINNFTGLDLIPFELNNTTFEIPVKSQLKKKYLFTYKPAGKPKVVNLFGQFNSWNRQNLPMKDKNGDGVYEISIPLDPGRYEYKFYVDGKELIDPGNPVKVPNGMGDFNSVRVIEESTKDKMFLHILGSEKGKNILSLKFYFENTDRSNLVKPESVVALFDNEKFPGDKTEITGREITLRLNEEMLEGNHTVRIAVNRMDNCSNIQTVRLHNGVIAGTSDYKTLNDNIIYCLMIDRFFDGDSSNSIPIKHDSLFAKANYEGGDLKGILDKIETGYFDSLGVNTLWISPIVDNTNNAYREYPAPHRWY